MRKFLVLTFLLLVLAFPGSSLASSASSVVETQVESSGETQVYQSVETTVDGETVKKESNQPGKLELEMRKTGEGEPTVTFSQEPITATQAFSFLAPVIEFFRNLFFHLTNWLR